MKEKDKLLMSNYQNCRTLPSSYARRLRCVVEFQDLRRSMSAEILY